MRFNWKRFLLRGFGFIFLLLAAFTSFILYETRDEIQATPDNIKAKLEEVFNKDRMAGAAMAVVTADSILYQGTIGLADRERDIPYTITQGQYVASVAKTVIGVALMKGQELGLFDLDDPVNDHLPFQLANPAFPDVPITIKQLATHTSSLDYNEAVVESLYIEDSLKDASLERFMNAYFVTKEMGEVTYLAAAPGTQWSYSNIGAALAAYVIEVKSGLSFAGFCQQHIFDPLGMVSTSWLVQDSIIQYYAKDESSGVLQPVHRMGVQLYPARDLFTNVKDLSSYLQAIIRRDARLLTAESYQELLSPALAASVTDCSADQHGIFWMIDRNQYGITYSMIGMNGGDSGINTMMWFDPKTDLGYIFIGNTGQSEKSKGNHIWLYRTLVSLGDYHILNDPKRSFGQKLAFRWYNWKSRVGGLF